MATKPVTTPFVWSPNVLYTTGPFIGLSTKTIPVGAVAVDGHRPGAADPTPSEFMNYIQAEYSDWLTWVYNGQATAAGNTHLMETDVDGRTGIVGIDLTDVVDRPLGTWVGGNTLVPAILITSGGGTCIQASPNGGGGAAYAADLTAAGAGIGFTCIDNILSPGTMFSALLVGGGGIGTIACTGSTTGLYLSTVDGDTLTLTCTGNGAPLVMPSKAPPAVAADGQIWIDSIDNYLRFVDPTVTTKRVWSTEEGLFIQSDENAGPYTAAISVASILVNFVAGKTYKISYGYTLGRTLASTRNGIDYANVGGFAFPAWFGQQLDLFQGGAAQYERDYSKVWLMQAAFGGPATIDIYVGSTAGGGTVQVVASYVTVEGVFD